MTFVLTAINPSVAIWQSTDHRLIGSRPDDDYWSKQVAIYCSNGSMLLAYSGLGWTPTRQSIAQWICKVVAPEGPLVGESYEPHWNTVEEVLTLLRDAATRDFSHGPRDYRRARLGIVGGVFANGGTYYVSITNMSTSGTFDHYRFASERVDHAAHVYGNGSGASDPISYKSGERIAKIIERRPRRLVDYLALLADTNAEVARRNATDVTLACQTACMPRGGLPLFAKTFHPSPGTSVGLPQPLRVVMGGSDMTPVVETMRTRAGSPRPGRVWATETWTLRHVRNTRGPQGRAEHDDRGPTST